MSVKRLEKQGTVGKYGQDQPDSTYTVDDAVQAIGFGWFQVKLSMITGLCWMSDAMEMMLLSFLAPALTCAWNIPGWKKSLITSSVPFGMMVSSAFWGKLSDKHGRKKALVLSSSMIFLYGFLSSFAPTYWWLLTLRTLVGIFIGCLPQSVTLYAEFLPTNSRAKCLILLNATWAFGSVFVVLIALVVMPSLGWRWLLGIASLPVLLFTIVCTWMPESARYYAAAGKIDDAKGILVRIAESNGKELPKGNLVTGKIEIQRGRIRDLVCKPELRTTTLLLWYIWFACAFCYYGFVIIASEIFILNDPCYGGTRATGEDDTCSLTCRGMTSDDYVSNIWVTLAEFPGIFLTLWAVEQFGRKMGMLLLFAIFAIFDLFLLLCTSRLIVTIILFVCRAVVSGVFQAAYVYAPEVYPTPVRAIGLGSCSMMARVGAICTPFVAQALLHYNTTLTFIVFFAVGFLAAVFAFLLPIETKNMKMSDTVMMH